jgi:hypothetical protein
MVINTAPASAKQVSPTIAVVAPAPEKYAIDRSSALWQQPRACPSRRYSP